MSVNVGVQSNQRRQSEIVLSRLSANKDMIDVFRSKVQCQIGTSDTNRGLHEAEEISRSTFRVGVTQRKTIQLM